MKKGLKIFGIFIVLFIIAAIAIPVLFKDKFAEIAKKQLNDNLNATVDFSDVDISLLRNFPKASILLENMSIINVAPFEGDTLFYAKEIALKMPIGGLFKTAAEQIEINSFSITDAVINIITDKKGNVNYDITKESDSPASTEENTESTGFQFAIANYAIKNARINYIDEPGQLKAQIHQLNHSGSGDLSDELITLITKTDALVSIEMEGTNYLKKQQLALDATFEINPEAQKYTFLENTFSINQLQLKFDGFVQQHANGNEFDLKFNTLSAGFKNFIALLPAQYTKDIANITTNGSFTVNGFAKGMLSDKTIPKFDIQILSKDASFKYPDLPKKVENIQFDARIANNTGLEKDTYLDIKKMSLQIDEDVFNGKATIRNLTTNASVNATLDGTLNLANISKAYPIALENDLKGIVTANLTTHFTQKAIEKNQYEQIKNNGDFSISDFEFSSKDIVNPIHISKANITFNPRTVTLEKFNATSGKSDIQATGTIDNLVGFLFSGKDLKGNFNVNSTLFKVSDFMVDNTSTPDNTQKKSSQGEALKIPAFIDAKIHANAKTVLYDNLILKNVKGDLVIKNEAVSLQNLKTNTFDGSMIINGTVSTKTEVPTFNLDLAIDKFDIGQSFKGMDMLTSIAPIADLMQGKFNTNLKLKGTLDKEFSPNMNTLTGNALAEVLTSKITPKEGAAFKLLNDKLPFINLEKLNLEHLKTILTFENGAVKIKPFTIAYQDIKINIAGGHGFDNTLGYTATFDVPAKYFGNEVSSILSKLKAEDVKNITIPVIATIGGSFSSPAIKTDLKQSVANLTKQLIQVQKEKLISKGTSALSDLLGNVLKGNKTVPKETDTTKTDSTKTTKETAKDAVKDAAKDAVKNVLGGLFGKKKKKE
ncbi:MAG: AsmA family protein [Flavobacteriaceae bacterium]|nr:MAG: AsmA family protein [Flavobacteriaceae bacterium]